MNGAAPAITIRYADALDAATITDLTNRAYVIEEAIFGEGHLRTDIEEIRASLADAGTFFLLGESAGRVVTSVRVMHQPDGLYFSMLSIDPGVQALGLGGTMVRAVEAEARKRGLPYVRLNCIKERNLPAYYSRLGYAPTHEERETIAGVGITFTYMERNVCG